jgi:hypothetical protein
MHLVMLSKHADVVPTSNVKLAEVEVFGALT